VYLNQAAFNNAKPLDFDTGGLGIKEAIWQLPEVG
jgi:hypothetical protein